MNNYEDRTKNALKNIEDLHEMLVELYGIEEEWERYCNAKQGYVERSKNGKQGDSCGNSELWRKWCDASSALRKKIDDSYEKQVREELCSALHMDPQTSPLRDCMSILGSHPHLSSNYIFLYSGPQRGIEMKANPTEIEMNANPTELDKYLNKHPVAVKLIFEALGFKDYNGFSEFNPYFRCFITDHFREMFTQSRKLKPHLTWEEIFEMMVYFHERSDFCKRLTEVYLANESADAYTRRRNNEGQNMRKVLSILNHPHPTQDLNGNVVPLLLAAQNLTLTDGKDFYFELVTHPIMRKALDSLQSSKTLSEYLESRSADPNSRRYPFTPCEEEHKMAEKLIKQYSLKIPDLETTLNNIPRINIVNRNVMLLYSAVARTMGQKPTVRVNGNGTYDFSIRDTNEREL